MQSVRIVVITGLSGSGKSTAIRALEDLDYFCVDNLPVILLPKFLELATASGHSLDKLGLVVDVRERGFLDEAHEVLSEVRSDGHWLEVVFLTADVNKLVQRFSETRRKHPLATGGDVREGLLEEVEALTGLRQMADHHLDTTALTVHELRKRIQSLFDPSRDESSRMAVNVISFGFRNGVPREADLVFDVRFLPNPHYVSNLRPLTGQSEPVADFVLGKTDTQEFLTHLYRMMDFLLPRYEAEGKSYLTIAIGCTGGQHRSVAISEEVARRLRPLHYETALRHRDMPR